MNDVMNHNLPELDRYIAFLNRIGIDTCFNHIDADCFLPGLYIQNGGIIIDKEKLSYPGDILHEAGHIAVVPSSERATLNAGIIGERQDHDAEEMMAIAWSYAACIHLNMDPRLVFHDHGYKGGGKNIVDNFNDKKYFGVPMLQWIGLTTDDKNALNLNVAPYPHMIKWVRDD